MSETEQKAQSEDQPQEAETPAETTEEQPAPTEATEQAGDASGDGDAKEGGAEEAVNAETEESKPILENPTENPFSEDDLEQVLQLEASEGEDKGWEKSKKIKGVTVFKKPEKNGVPLVKVRFLEHAPHPILAGDEAMSSLTSLCNGSLLKYSALRTISRYAGLAVRILCH